MDLSDKFLQLPKAIVMSYYEDANRVIVQGNIKADNFNRQFKATMTGSALTAEKAVHLAMQTPSRPLTSIQDLLYYT